jgi:hypothetical protein
MSEDRHKNSADGSEEIEKEVRTNRKFSLSEAIGQLAGGDVMKGGSPLSRKRQAEIEIEEYLRRHLADSGCVLRSVLLRHLGDSLLKSDYTEPLAALAEYLPTVLASEHLLREIVCEADAEWGRVQGERPYFQDAGREPDPNDPYTIDSVRLSLLELRQSLASREQFPQRQSSREL